MKTTVDLPDELLIAAKKRAAEERTSLRNVLARGLRRELGATARKGPAAGGISWTVVDGGLPPGLDLSDRRAMHDWLGADRR